MIITMILIFAFGVMVGVGITGIFGGRQYDKGYKDGKNEGYTQGYKTCFQEIKDKVGNRSIVKKIIEEDML